MRIRIEPITEQNQKDVLELEAACGQEGFVESVELLEHHPLIPDNVTIYGYVMDTATGKLMDVE